jgi:transposase
MGKSITDLLSVTTVGRIWRSTFFKSIRSMLLSALWSPRRSGAISCWSFSLRCRLVGVGLEASGSAHHWARELIKLGHNARMVPPAYVKPYISSAEERRGRRGGDLRGGDAAFDAVCRRDRSQGPRHACELAGLIEACDETIPFEACEALAPLAVQLRNLDEAIARLERTIAKLARKDETARRLMSIPGFGPITASARAATIQDTSSFAGPREFAAFLGLEPKQNSSGGKPKLGRISKMGNRNLRKLLVVGAHAVLFHRKPHTDPLRMWAKRLIEKKPFKLVAVALANKMARIAFAIMRGTTVYREIPA